jgi:hypothetical protein
MARIARQRLGELPERYQCVAAIVQRQKIVWTSLQCEIDPAHRLGVIAALIKNDAEQVQAVKMIGPGRKNLIVDPFRIGQPAGLMQRQSLPKQRCDRRRH